MNFPGKKSEWNGFVRYDFELEGIPCLIVCPKAEAPGKRWMWRARFFDAFPNADLAILEKGWYVAYIDIADLYGAPEAMRRFDMFYKYLTEELGFTTKTVLEGYSRGGLPIFNWGRANTEKVSCIYADNPVCDFKSWPGGLGEGPGSENDWKKCLKAYGLSHEEALKYDGNPVDNVKPLADAGIPLIFVIGDADEVVPIQENTLPFVERYKALGGEVEVISKPGGLHHPHCLENPAPIIDFIFKHQ
jgi:pimeloyl-ACP methyl ester carboxylesterase